MTRHDASTGAVGVLLALALAPAFWPSDAIAQGCFCDVSTTQSGVTGLLILEQLCPAKALGQGVQWLDGTTITGVQSGDSGLAYEVGISGPVVECGINDGVSPPVSVKLSADEAQACRAHLRVSCGQPVP
jgi:hypothetical protein